MPQDLNHFEVPYSPLGSTHSEEDVEAVRRVLFSGKTLSCGEERTAFEKEFAAFFGVKHAVAVANCTVALELATHLCDLRQGDEVIVTPQTYQATAAPLLLSPATVRFCDIDPRTLNVDIASIERLITPATKAIYVVHYGGALVDIANLKRIAEASGIIIVEDAAHALADYPGLQPGSLGIGCFSFQSYKNITTLGEGGMFTTNDDALAARARRIISIEPDASFQFRNETALGNYDAPPEDAVFRHEKNSFIQDLVEIRHAGTNSTLAEPAAAVGRLQLKRLPELVARRRQIADEYNAVISRKPGYELLNRPTASYANHLFTFFVTSRAGRTQGEILRALQESGIEMQQRYFPIHLLPEWRHRGHALGESPAAEYVWFNEQVNLPIYPQMTDDMVNFVCKCLDEVLV